MKYMADRWPYNLFDKQGNYITNPNYRAIIRLHEMLETAGIPHTFVPMMDGWQIAYPVDRHDIRCVMDAVEHHGSYGHEADLIEIMGLLTPEEQEWDSVVGHLTAQEVFDRIRAHWMTVQGKEVRG